MTNRHLRVDRASPRQLLARILDEPSLVATVQNLPPRTLGRLINRVGLEDSSEIISLATTEQIKQIFDDDLWKSDRPRSDEAFDADRFALWLEVMLEAGEGFVAQKLLELPEDMVTLALHRHLLVLDMDQRRAEMEDRRSASAGGCSTTTWRLPRAMPSRAFTARAHMATGELRRAHESSAKFVAEKRAQGKPALARNRLADLAMDEVARAVVEGLLGDCPLLVGPLVRRGADRYQLWSRSEVRFTRFTRTRRARRPS